VKTSAFTAAAVAQRVVIRSAEGGREKTFIFQLAGLRTVLAKLPCLAEVIPATTGR